MSEGGLSLARGPDQPALLEQTIGANLEATIARHGDREALVSCPQGLGLTYTEFGDAVERQPRLPHVRAGVRAAPVGLPDADRRAGV